jgi:hypothetical protein
MNLDQRFRDSGKALILAIWEQEESVLTPTQKIAFGGVSSAQDIVRRRRELSLKYPANEAVLAKRFKNYKEHLEYYGTTPARGLI